MLKYQVFIHSDGMDIPADSAHTIFLKGQGLDNSIFDTKREAEIYAWRWAHPYEHKKSNDEIKHLVSTMRIDEVYFQGAHRCMKIKTVNVIETWYNEIKEIAN